MKTVFKEDSVYRLIPIYSDRLLICVTSDVERSRLARNHLFGEPCNDHSGWTGLCAWSGFRIALFFDRSELCHDLISHEVFHAAHRVMERHGVAFGVHNHEPFAHLAGWLTGLVYSELDRMGAKINLRYSKRKYMRGEPKLRFVPIIEE